MQRKKKIILVVKIAVAVMVLYYLFSTSKIDIQNLRRLLLIQNLPIVLLSGFFFYICQALVAKRITILLRMIDYSLSFVQSFKLIMITNFFNLVMPGSVGGDVVKGYYLSRDQEYGIGKAAGIIILDRALGMLAILFIGTFSLIYVFIDESSLVNRLHYEFITILLTFGAGLFSIVIIFILGYNDSVRDKMRTLSERLFKRRNIYFMIKSLGLLPKNPGTFFQAFAMSILIQLSTLFGILILYGVVSQEVPDYIMLLAASSITIVLGQVLPITPGNIGWTELVAYFTWSAAGSGVGGEVFLLWRVVYICCSLPGGLWYVFFSPDLRLGDLEYQQEADPLTGDNIDGADTAAALSKKLEET